MRVTQSSTARPACLSPVLEEFRHILSICQESRSLSRVYLHSIVISLQCLLKIISKLNIISLAMKKQYKTVISKAI